MRIGFDGKRAMQNFTGLGNYSRYVVDILCRFQSENDYILYAPKLRENRRLEMLTEQYRQQLRLSFPVTFFWRKLSTLWRVWGISNQLRQEKVDIFHGLSNELPLTIRRSKAKSVVTIHDLIFLRYPQYYRFIDRKIYAYKFRKACERADAIIAVSECTKQDIIRFFRIPADKITVVYQGCDHSFTEPVSDERKQEVRKHYQLPDRYILHVGSIEERKNMLAAVQALPALPPHIHLVIVGRCTAYTTKIEQFIEANGLTHRVHLLSNVSFRDLPAIYQSADIFVYPSRFEGFGIPIIEALSSGIPVVAATGSCLEEAGGPDSIYVHPDNITEMSRALNLILANPDRRKEMIKKGLVYVRRFSEEKQAMQIMNIYNTII